MSEPFTLRALISRGHLDEQRRLHAMPEGYGGKGMRHREFVRSMLKELGCKSGLDYGCGQGTLWGKSYSRERDPNWALQGYDPAVDAFSAPPLPADLVVCTDVMEHVEQQYVATVVDHLFHLTQIALYVVVALTETSKRFSDGRSAHVMLRPAQWWADEFATRFQPFQPQRDDWTPTLSAGPPKHWAALLIPRT